MTTTDDQDVIETPADGTTPDEKQEDKGTDTSENKKSVSELEQELIELREKNARLYARVQRGKSEDKPEAKGKAAEAALSTSDMYTLVKADVHPDDIQEVIDYATLKKISVKDAVNTSVVKNILSDKKAERESSSAANTKVTPKAGNGRISDEQLVINARKGIMPDNDEDMSRLISVRKKFS